MEIYRLEYIKKMLDFSSIKDEENRYLLFIQRYKKYKHQVDRIPLEIVEWMDTHLSRIGLKYITDELVEKELDPSTLKLYKKNEQEMMRFKKFLAEIYAQDIELMRFYVYRLENLLESINSVLSDRRMSRSEKQDKLENLFLLYDIFRVLGKEFRAQPTQLRYFDKTGKKVDIEEVNDLLYSLTIPDDFRACRMFFDLYRVCGDASKTYWCFFYSYFYIHRIFAVTNYDDLGFRMFPTIIPDEVYKLSLVDLLKMLDACLKDAINRLDARKKCIDSKTYDSFRVNKYTILRAPFEKSCRADGIKTGKKNLNDHDKTRNMVYALANSLVALDLIVDNLNWLLQNNDEIISENKNDLAQVYSSLDYIRAWILYNTYNNNIVYQEGQQKYRLADIISSENAIASQIAICTKLDRISRLISVDSLELIMEEKKEISAELQELIGASSISPYVIDKLEEILENTITRLHDEIISEKLADSIAIGIKESLKNLGIRLNISETDDYVLLLSSAEFLYQKYLNGSADNNLDYSFVAILYYKALECVLNKFFYVPYIQTFAFNAKGNKKKISTHDFSQYFDPGNYDYLTRYSKMKDSLELGALGNVLSNPGSYTSNMAAFLSKIMDIANYSLLQNYGKRLIGVSKKRNNAAHGTVIISFADAKDAKEETFVIEPASANTWRGLIIEFLSYLK